MAKTFSRRTGGKGARRDIAAEIHCPHSHQARAGRHALGEALERHPRGRQTSSPLRHRL